MEQRSGPVEFRHIFNPEFPAAQFPVRDKKSKTTLSQTMVIDRLILGKRANERHEGSDKTLLTGYFLFMYIGIDIFFLFVNLFNPNAHNSMIFVGMGVTLGCLLLLRAGWRNTAILIQLIRTNYVAFHYTYTDIGDTGNYFYFIASGIGAMALYGYEDRWRGIAFSAISLTLFYVAVLKWEGFTPDNAHFFLIMNFTISYIMGFIIIYFLNQLTFFSRSKATEKNVQLEKVNSELDRFVYSVSHDLRAPLSSIAGLIQLSEKSSDLAEIRQYLDLMKGRIARLEQFIRDIINFSRNARAEVRFENVKLKELVNETFETLKFISGAENVRLDDQLEESLIVSTDKMRLQIVLFNLISNAIQYRDPYKNSYVRFSCKSDNGVVFLQVEDNGIGIDEPHRPKVFNMFYRATENSKGSGLGLYIVKETMERLGGHVALNSAFGEGTKFTLTLPANGH